MQVDLSVISLVPSETPDSAAGDQRAVCLCGQGNRRGMQEHRIPSRGCPLLVIGDTRVEPTSEDSESECVLVLDYNSSTRVLPLQFSGTGNQTLSVLTFTPTPADDGKYLSCRAENKFIPGSSIEDKWRLVVHCKCSSGSYQVSNSSIRSHSSLPPGQMHPWSV